MRLGKLYNGRDKTFFFASYEGLRLPKQTVLVEDYSLIVFCMYTVYSVHTSRSIALAYQQVRGKPCEFCGRLPPRSVSFRELTQIALKPVRRKCPPGIVKSINALPTIPKLAEDPCWFVYR